MTVRKLNQYERQARIKKLRELHHVATDRHSYIIQMLDLNERAIADIEREIFMLQEPTRRKKVEAEPPAS